MVRDDRRWRLRQFWDGIAPKYDGLYADAWSLREDSLVVDRLGQLDLATPVRMLDLGCGTGLGLSFGERTFGDVLYCGVDISDEMLKRFQHEGCASVKSLICGDMTDLSMFEDNSFDLVSGFSGSSSYLADLGSLVGEAFRVLAEGAVLFLSVFNRWSLRRLARFRLHPVEMYGTRGVSTSMPLPEVRAWSAGEIAKLLRHHSFVDVHIESDNAFAGLLQLESTWAFGRFVGRRLGMGHMLYVVGRKAVS